MYLSSLLHDTCSMSADSGDECGQHCYQDIYDALQRPLCTVCHIFLLSLILYHHRLHRFSQIHQVPSSNFYLYFFKCEASLRAERTDSAMVATKETIEYRFHSRLHSAQRMQDKFILVAAVEVASKRMTECHCRRRLPSAQRVQGKFILAVAIEVQHVSLSA